MATVKRVLTLLLLLVPFFAAAQDSEESRSRITRTSNGEFRISQTISFPAVPGTERYEVEIESAGEGGFSEKLITETNKFEVSLRAGSYRYRITSINKMNLPEGRSDWQELTIIPAVEPVLETYQPFYGLFFEMANPDGILVVSGRDFSSETEFAMVEHRTNFDWSEADLKTDKKTFFPNAVVINDDNTRAELSFSRGTLKRGDYDIFARNPGGLWTLLGKVRVGYKRSMDFTFAFGYSPMLAAFDFKNATYSGDNGSIENTLDLFNPKGFYMRFGWFFLKTMVGNFGVDLTGQFLVTHEREYESSQDPGENEYDPAFLFSFVYQQAVNEKWQHNLRIGIGYADQVYHDDYDFSETLLDFGLFTQFFIWKNLYIEAGLDVQYLLGVNHIMVRPGIGAGWQFGRWGEYAYVKNRIEKGEDPSVPVTDMPKSEWTLSLGWSPMIPLFGMDQGLDIGYLQPFNLLGAVLRASYLPHRWGNNRLGAELELYVLRHHRAEEITSVPPLVNALSHAFLGVLYQRILTETWSLDFRMGGGISHPYQFESEEVTIEPSINAGVSAQYFFWKNCYAEAGIDYVMTFGDTTHGILRPTISIGWQFNRTSPTGFK